MSKERRSGLEVWRPSALWERLELHLVAALQKSPPAPPQRPETGVLWWAVKLAVKLALGPEKQRVCWWSAVLQSCSLQTRLARSACQALRTVGTSR